MTLLINLSCLIPQPSGISVYALNVLPHLHPLDPVVLSNEAVAGFYSIGIPFLPSGEEGRFRHVRRLAWIQFGLPRCYRQQAASLLFSPLPEAPLHSGCRSVVMAHDVIPLRFPVAGSPLLPYFRHYVPQVLRQAQHIICNSQATADDLIQFYGLPARQITPIPLAYDPTHFRWLNLPTQPYFLYVGRLDPHKNLARLITAFAHLPRELSVELWLAGSSDSRYRPPLEAQVEELGIHPRVKWLDYVPLAELPILLNQALALVFPSLWEGFGLPIVEAMACGTPVITSNRASLAEIGADAALLVDPENIDALQAAMQQVATDPQLFQQLRQKGLERSRRFSWQNTGAATLGILRQHL
ncbi:MAG: glycosyltransferase family 1 protein [Cyanobacteriota bacterium]|nr:glycosyltransferase family 1 protein [Cyanobacteriota bacterium]